MWISNMVFYVALNTLVELSLFVRKGEVSYPKVGSKKCGRKIFSMQKQLYRPPP